MPWALSTESHQSYPAPAGGVLYIVAGADDAGLSAARDAPEDASLILGTLVVHSYGAKLEAGCGDLTISPPARLPKHRQNGNGDPPVEAFVLQAKTNNRVETIILRHLDKISSIAKPEGALTFEWKPPQIQVQSSEQKAEVAEAEDETEDDDDEDLDNTVVPGIIKSQTMRSTPHLSISHSEVIQETPTINRVGKLSGLTSRIDPPRLSIEASSATAAVYSPAPQQQSIVNDLALSDGLADVEASDALPQKPRNPKEELPKSKSTKRSEPAKEEPSNPVTRATKRRKVSDGDGDATPVQTAPKTATKKRQSTIKAESTPSRSQRSTQGSISGSPVDVGGDYDGPKPRVALSNSSIQPNSGFGRFLKKHGGNIVDAVEGDCNILCVKEGPILKTGKLLQAVAQGLPVVTDKWLIDSSKASRFLPLDSYKPPDLEPVWRIPQDRLLKGYTIYFTPALKANYKGTAFGDMEKLCKAIGARRVVSKKAGGKDLDKDTIYLAEAEGDPDVPALLELGHTCYTKDFLTHSIIMGNADLDSDEFKVQVEEAKPAKKRGRARNG